MPPSSTESIPRMNGEKRRAPPSTEASASKEGPSLLGAVDLVLAGEGAASDLAGIGRDGAFDPGGEIVVALHETRSALEHSEHVLGDQDLAVAARRGADADGRAGDG